MKKDIYLDHNATTPMHKEVVAAMEPFYASIYGNASSIHQMGQQARAAVQTSRETIASFLGTEAGDIIFTSGGTESNNLAIEGVLLANKSQGNHIITSKVEHLSVLGPCKFLENNGFKVTYLDVDKYGQINPEDLKKAINEETILVSIIHGNNEVGTIQPIRKLVEIVKLANKQRINNSKTPIYFHADTVQSFGKIPVDVEDLGVDLLSISSHKIYGPKGIGALYIRKGTKISACQRGGHHENNLRAGTENVPAIVGFGKAVELAKKNFHKNENVRALRNALFKGLKEKVSSVYLNGHPEERLPGVLNVSFEAIDGEALLLNFDMNQIYASTGSACTSGALEESHVLKAMNIDLKLARSAVRFSLGLGNTKSDIDFLIREIPVIVKKLRAIAN